jgi:glycosyltransferase involved in cell wall biosynthesis
MLTEVKRMTYEPPITVVVATRNRETEIGGAVEAILRNDYPDFEVRVIDQSDGTETEASVRRFLSDPRFRYFKATARGVAAGRNLGIEGAKNEIVAMTDDDCRTPPDWLHELALAFGTDRRIGVVFGNVHPGPHDSRKGFVPSYTRKDAFLARSILDKRRVEGISACMGLKKSVWRALSGFDELLGSGAPFRSAEETDFTIRTLLAGYCVFEAPPFSVLHLGFRAWDQGRDLIEGYLYGIGAALVKNLKCRHGSVLLILLSLMGRWAAGQPRVDLGHVPPRGLRLRAFIRGFIAGAAQPVNRATGHYRLAKSGPGMAKTP